MAKYTHDRSPGTTPASDSKSPPQTPPTSRILTRRAVAQMLRISVSGVRYLERRGKLTPQVDRRGVHRFDRKQVEALGLALRRDGRRTQMGTITGDLAARVFRMIRDGLSFPEVVIKTEETPETIRALWREYRRSPDDEDEEPVQADDSSDYERRMRKLDEDIVESRRRRQGER